MVWAKLAHSLAGCAGWKRARFIPQSVLFGRLQARYRGCDRSSDHRHERTGATGRCEIKALDELKARLLEVEDLKAAASLLRWDQMTYMPPGGGTARGRQIGTLSRLAHEKFTDAAVGRLLDRLEKETAFSAESDEAALVRVTRRLY